MQCNTACRQNEKISPAVFYSYAHIPAGSKNIALAGRSSGSLLSRRLPD